MRRILVLAAAALACSRAPSPVIDSFTVDDSNPDIGAAVQFSYAVRGAATVRIDPAPGVVQRSPVSVVPPASGNYTLRATNEDGVAATRALAITLRPLLAIDAVDARPGLVAPGADVTLAWTTTSAERATLTDGSSGQATEVHTSGSLVVNLQTTTIYTLTAYNQNGRQPASVSAKIAARVGIPPSVSDFRADKLSIVQGDRVTLSWSGNAVSYSVSDGTTTFQVGPLRSLVVRPAATATYTLHAVGAGGEVVAPPLTVTVEPHAGTALKYTASGSGPLQVIADDCSASSCTTMTFRITSSVPLRGLALNLPLDSSKVSLDGFGAGASVPGVISKVVMGTDLLHDVLVVGVALPGNGVAPARDATWSGELVSFTLRLLPAGGIGTVFDGAALPPGYKAVIQTGSGRMPVTIALGKLDAN